MRSKIRRRDVLALGLCAPALLTRRAQAQTPSVDLLLVLAADVSRSIDRERFELQRQGYLTALTNPDVVDAMTSGKHGAIGLTFIEWSTIGQQKVLVDWSLIDGEASAHRFTEQFAETPRSFEDGTAIGEAVLFSVWHLGNAPFISDRRTVDISGDGTSNKGVWANVARDEAVRKGVTINGVVILNFHPEVWNQEHSNPRGGLEKWYREYVIGGPNSFVEVARGFESFGAAIRKKLITEVA